MNLFQIILALILITWSSALFTQKLEQDDRNMLNSVIEKRKEQGSGCLCEHYTCGCCDNINWLKAIGKLCTNISYLAEDYGFSLTLTWNNYVLYNNTISARNPPAFCVDIPELEKIGEICLRLYDLSVAPKHFHGCMELKVILWHTIHKTVRIGCITIPNNINKPSISNHFLQENQSSILVDHYQNVNYLSNNSSPSVILIT